MLTLTIPKLYFPGNAPIANPLTVALYYKEYYSGTYILIGSGINVNVDGTINESPLPSVSIDPTEKYVLKAVNEMCGSEYEQNLFIYPYCPVNYSLSEDLSSCYIEEYADPTPPSNPENSVSSVLNTYGICGSYIYDNFNFNGTGVYNQISLSNAFWRNGTGNCSTPGNTSNGPLNRSGLWSSTVYSGQQIGFSICIEITTTKTYYIGIGADNFGVIKIDGNTIIQQDPLAMDSQFGTILGRSTYYAWNIYPIVLEAGLRSIEMLGQNEASMLPNPAAMGAEIYDNTPAEISAATSYGGLNLIFSTKDYVGQPIQIGTNDLGYQCPTGYSLIPCESPVVCRKITTIPVLY